MRSDVFAGRANLNLAHANLDGTVKDVHDALASQRDRASSHDAGFMWQDGQGKLAWPAPGVAPREAVRGMNAIGP